MAHLGVKGLEVLLRDRILGYDEVRLLMADLLASGEDPRGETSVDEWLAATADRLGTASTSYRERYETSS